MCGRIVAPSGELVHTFSVKRTSPSSYVVSFVPSEEGQHTLVVDVAGEVMHTAATAAPCVYGPSSRAGDVVLVAPEGDGCLALAP